MKKKSTGNKVLDIFRWLTLLPLMYGVWYALSVCIIWVLLKLNLLAKHFILSEVITILFICCATFFVAKMYAPKYKKLTAWIITAVFLIWQVALFYHMKY